MERHGAEFTTEDVADTWLANLPGGRVFTAERAAYRNLLSARTRRRTGARPQPLPGVDRRADPHRRLRLDPPGDPATAARLAWRDARLSHVRNGVYGAMFVAAMCAQAVVSDDVDTVLEAGLSVVPPRSRYAEAVAFGAGSWAGPRRTPRTRSMRSTTGTATCTGCTSSTTPH